VDVGAALLFCNADEAQALSGTADLDAQMRALGGRYGRVVIKRGSLGRRWEPAGA
jgi:sugar/nucleoside kinase (ribokinase family)